jgi:hypothetical protein
MQTKTVADIVMSLWEIFDDMKTRLQLYNNDKRNLWLLLEPVGASVKKEDTYFQISISPAQKLLFTLKYFFIS